MIKYVGRLLERQLEYFVFSPATHVCLHACINQGSMYLRHLDILSNFK